MIIKKLKNLINLDHNETAKQSLERYKELINTLINYNYNDWKQIGKINTKKITIEQLKNEERRLNFKLPKSYKEFIIKNGLISFPIVNQEFIFPYKKLIKGLKDEWELENNEIEKTFEDSIHPNDIVIFSITDEFYQDEYHCFEPDKTIHIFNRDELGLEKNIFKSFDEYMQWLINKFIIVNVLENGFNNYDYVDLDEYY